jgi:mRNA interferase MazF
MNDFSQGDIIKISGFNYNFIIVSKNAFINATSVFHVCPIFKNVPEGPLHIYIAGKIKETGTVICEQIKLIDPTVRGCGKIDSVSYETIMNISDAIQGIFEYD